MSVINQMLSALDARHAQVADAAGPAAGAAVSGVAPLRPQAQWSSGRWRPKRWQALAALGTVAVGLVAFGDPNWLGRSPALSTPTPPAIDGLSAGAGAASASASAVSAASAASVHAASSSALGAGIAPRVETPSAPALVRRTRRHEGPAPLAVAPSAPDSSRGAEGLALRAERVMLTPVRAVGVERQSEPSAPSDAITNSPAVHKRMRVGGVAQRAAEVYRRALDLAESGHSSQALALSLEALQSDPDLVEARQLAAVLLAESRRLHDAQALLRDGLSRAPRQPALSDVLARLLVQTGQSDEALRVLGDSATLSAEGFGLRGGIFLQRGQGREAAAAYEAAVRLAPDAAAWWVGLGLSLDALGQAPAARQAYERAALLGRMPSDVAELVRSKLGER